MATEAQIKALPISPVARIAKASDTGGVFVLGANQGGNAATPVAGAELVWHVRQASAAPGPSVLIPTAFANTQVTWGVGASTRFNYPLTSGPRIQYVTGTSTSPPWYVADGSGASYGAQFIWGGATGTVSLSSPSGVGLSAFLNVGTGGGNSPATLGPPGSYGTTTYFDPSTTAKLYARHSATNTGSKGPVRSFFENFFWSNAKPNGYFQTVLDALSAGAAAGDNLEWTAPADGVYLVEFRVPGKVDTSDNEWNYDLLVQDADNSSFTSLVNMGVTRPQEEFTDTGEATQNRAAHTYRYALRMSNGQKLRIILRSFKAARVAVTMEQVTWTPKFGTSIGITTGGNFAHPFGMRGRVISGHATTGSGSAQSAMQRRYDALVSGSPPPQGNDGRQYSLKLYRMA